MENMLKAMSLVEEKALVSTVAGALGEEVALDRSLPRVVFALAFLLVALALGSGSTLPQSERLVFLRVGALAGLARGGVGRFLFALLALPI